jgi:hypothetical protein
MIAVLLIALAVVVEITARASWETLNRPIDREYIGHVGGSEYWRINGKVVVIEQGE